MLEGVTLLQLPVQHHELGGGCSGQYLQKQERIIVCLRVLQQQDQRQEQIAGEGVAVLLRRPSIDRCPNNRRGRGRAISRETHQQHINSKTYQQHINAKTIGMKSGKALRFSAKSVVFLSDRCWTWSTLLFSIRKCI